jgi:lipopolysaccharide export system protein LptA
MPARIVCFISLLLSPTLCQGQILDRLGDKKDDAPIIIDAEQSVVCDEPAHKCTATGLAKAQKGTSILYGDVLTVYFTEGKKRDVTAITADGHVRMETPTEKAYGEHANYDVGLDRVLMTGGNLKVVTPKETLTAKDSIEYWHTKHQAVARGKAIARFNEKKQLVQADTLIAYFKPAKKEGAAAKEKEQIDRVEATGNVLASGPNGIVTADRGTYFGTTELIEVFDNVKLTQGGNAIQGGYGRANLKTNVAEIFPYPPHVAQTGPIKRISGIIIPKSLNNHKRRSPKASQ